MPALLVLGSLRLQEPRLECLNGRRFRGSLMVVSSKVGMILDDELMSQSSRRLGVHGFLIASGVGLV